MKKLIKLVLIAIAIIVSVYFSIGTYTSFVKDSTVTKTTVEVRDNLYGFYCDEFVLVQKYNSKNENISSYAIDCKTKKITILNNDR